MISQKTSMNKNEKRIVKNNVWIRSLDKKMHSEMLISCTVKLTVQQYKWCKITIKMKNVK